MSDSEEQLKVSCIVFCVICKNVYILALVFLWISINEAYTWMNIKVLKEN